MMKPHLWLAVILCFLVGGHFAFAQEPDRFLNIQEVTSPKGITAWLVEDHSLPLISMQFAFKGAGSKRDPEKLQGVARLLSNTLDEGASDLPSQVFQKQLSDHSITLYFTNGRDDFFGTLKTLTRHKDKAFELLTLALTLPRFDAEPLERMKFANIARLKGSLANPQWLAARILNDKAFEGHPYARNSGGTITDLQKITKADLKTFKNDWLVRNRLRIAVTGDITAEELAPLLDKVFENLPAKGKDEEIDPLPIQNQGKTFNLPLPIPQTVISVIQPGISRKDEAYDAARVMNYILGGGGFGSRLTEEVREKRGLTYGISSSLYNLDHMQGLQINTSTDNATVDTVLSIIEDELRLMRSQPVSDDELAHAKDYLIGSMPLALSSTEDIAQLVLGLQLDALPITYLDTKADVIAGISKTDILDVSQKILTPENLTTVLVGQPENLSPDTLIEIKEIPNAE